MASDGTGHGRAVRFDAPPSIVGEVAELLSSGLFPVYRSGADFWRDAAVHRLHDLAELVEDRRVADALYAFVARAEIHRINDQQDRLLAETERILGDLDKIKSRSARLDFPETFMADHLDRIEELALDLPADPRRKITAKIKSMRSEADHTDSPETPES